MARAILVRRVAAACAVAALVAAAVGAARAAAPRFYPDDPIWVEPVTENVIDANRYEPDLVYQTVENLFGRPGEPATGQRAQDVNTVDEVPDGPFFVNRAGRIHLTPDIVARASNQDEGPAPGPWTVVSAKSDGVTPGFTIRDTAKQIWFIKFDPPGWPNMATGTEVVAAKLFWALGFHTAEYHIVRLVPSNLVIDGGAKITPAGEMARAMRGTDVNWLLSRADRGDDGSYRVIASKATPGRPVGRISFHGTRADDPNDVVPHEHRRELRGYYVFSAWLNHVDAKGINSISMLMSENGRSFIRHYLLDFGSVLGSAAVGPREKWEGYEPIVEPFGEIGKRVLSLGFRIPIWRRQDYIEMPAIGRVPQDHAQWDPRKWWPHITNSAFRHMRPDDAFWAAWKIAQIDEPMIRAAVAEGRFGTRAADEALVMTIVDRRRRILETYLPAVNPIVDPSIGADGRLSFRNAAVEMGVAAPPESYKAEWSVYDNDRDVATPLDTTGGLQSPLLGPAAPAGARFIKVAISAGGGPESWNTPVTAYFRRTGDGWSLVGFERLP